jgi:hypothetical protein
MKKLIFLAALAIGCIYFINSLQDEVKSSDTSITRKITPKLQETIKIISQKINKKNIKSLEIDLIDLDLNHISKLSNTKTLDSLNTNVSILISNKYDCITDESCINPNWKEDEYMYEDDTPSHKTLLKLLKVQRTLITMGLSSKLTKKQLSSLYQFESNSQIRKELIAISHLDTNMKSVLKDHLYTTDIYTKSSDFSEISELEGVIDEELRPAFTQLIFKFVQEENIPVKTYIDQLVAVNVDVFQKEKMMRTICETHKLDIKSTTIMKYFYKRNNLNGENNACI